MLTPDLLTAATQSPVVESPDTTASHRPDFEETIRAVTAFAELTFRLAGRLPDDVAAIIRTRIADNELAEAGQVLVSTLAGAALQITPTEAAMVESCLVGVPADAQPLSQAVVTDRPARQEYRFSPALDGPAPRLLEAAISVTDWADGLLGLWHTLRTSSTTTAAPVWLGEARDDADLVEITAEIQHRLALLGEVPPRVEVFAGATTLTAYHRDALARADLVWVAPGLPDLRIARAFDGVDPKTGPYFAPDHARLTGNDRDRVLAYLADAEVLPVSRGEMIDVMAPSTGAMVPITFRCDGTWIWPESVRYYLERHELAPDQALTDHVLGTGALPPALSPLTVARAIAAITDPEPPPAPEPGPVWGSRVGTTAGRRP